MALNLLRSGYATLEYEIAQERASALGRLGRRLEAALTALAACPRTANSDRKLRDRLVEQAGYAGLRGAERGVCPHGAIGHAEHPSDEDHRGLRKRRRQCSETRLSRWVAAILRYAVA
jgi:hypothetical protein